MRENWYDVASDLSAFHRIDDPLQVPAQRLIDLAVRCGAYQGMVAATARLEAGDGEPAEYGDDRMVDSSPAALMTDPVFGSMFEFGEGVG